jgi:hypothetical protein
MADSAVPTSPPPPPPDRHLAVLYGVLGALTVLAIVPVWLPDWLALFDYGGYLHQGAVIADWQLQPRYTQLFDRVSYPTPVWLVPNLLSVLALGVDVDTAGRILLTLGIGSVPWAALLLARAAGHSQWLALGTAAWMWHHDVALGHLPMVLALPLLLALLALHLHGLKHRGPWPLLGLVVGLAVLAVLHPLPWLVVALGLPALGLLTRVGVGGLRAVPQAALLALRDLALALPSAALLVPWAKQQVALAGSARLSWESNLPVTNLRLLADRLFDVFAPHQAPLSGLGDLVGNRPGDVVSFLWLFGLAFWVLGAIRQGRAEATQQGDVLAPKVGGTYLGWAVVLCLIGFFALPVTLLRPVWIGGLNVRLTGVLGVLAVLALPLRPLQPPADARWRTWLGTLLVFVAAAWMPLAMWRNLTFASAELGPMRAAMAEVPSGKTMIVLRQTADSRWHRYRVFHELQRWYPIWQGGLVGGGFPDQDLSPVKVKPKLGLPIPPAEDNATFDWLRHGQYYEYILVWRDPFESAPPFEAALRTLPRLMQRGKWTVYRNPRHQTYRPAAEKPILPAQQAPAHLADDAPPPDRAVKTGAGLLDDWLRTAGLPVSPPSDPGDFARAVRVLRYKLGWRGGDAGKRP